MTFAWFGVATAVVAVVGAGWMLQHLVRGVAVSPGGLVLAVRDSGTNVQADLLTASLADSTVGIAVGTGTTAINQIAAAFKSTQDGGQYRCWIAWHSNEQTSPTTNFECKSNYVDDAGAVGAQAVLVNRLGVASRAFEYNVGGVSRVLAWLAFGTGSRTPSIRASVRTTADSPARKPSAVRGSPGK